jgi:hypothetical protein
MAFPSAVLTLQGQRGLGGWKLQYLQSFQADRRATNWLDLIWRAAMSLRPAHTALSYVLASKSMPKFRQFKLSVALYRFK